MMNLLFLFSFREKYVPEAGGAAAVCPTNRPVAVAVMMGRGRMMVARGTAAAVAAVAVVIRQRVH